MRRAVPGTPFCLVRRACSAANGCKSRLSRMEVKSSEAQGRHCKVGSEGSVGQRYGPMDKNRIRGLRRRARPRLYDGVGEADERSSPYPDWPR